MRVAVKDIASFASILEGRYWSGSGARSGGSWVPSWISISGRCDMADCDRLSALVRGLRRRLSGVPRCGEGLLVALFNSSVPCKGSGEPSWGSSRLGVGVPVKIS